MKTKYKISLLSLLSTLSIVGAMIFASSLRFKLVVGSDGHSASCHWNHYQRVEPTYNDKGIQEYYVCCEHHDSVLERPSTGIISEAGTLPQSYINSLDDSDFRVIPSYRTQLAPIQSEIDAIPQYYDITDGSLIDKAYRDYNQLSDAVKIYIQDSQRLLDTYTNYHNNYAILIDATLNQYECQIYNSTYDLSCELDNEYGYYSSFSNITMTDDCWFGMGRNDPQSTLSYREVFFYAYNEYTEIRTIQLRDKYNFILYGSMTLQPKTWTKVTVPLDVFTTGKLQDLFIGCYMTGMTNTLVEKGFRYASMYGVLGKVTSQTYIDLNDDDFMENNVTTNGENVMLNEADYCALVTSTLYSEFAGKVNMITKNTYSNVTKVSFDAKIDGSATGWWGIGHSSSIETASIYTGMSTTSTSSTENQFKHFDFPLSITGPEYIYVIVEKNTFVKDLYIDNFTITCGSVTYTDAFDNGETTLFNDDPTVTAKAFSVVTREKAQYYLTHTPSNCYLTIDTANYGGEDVNYKATFISKETYTNVTAISFDAKVVGEMTPLSGSEQIWWGFGVSGDDDIYVTNFARQVLTTNNEWRSFRYEVSSPVSGYVKFVLNPAKTSCPIYIDNIVIETASNTYAEGFNASSSTLFNIGTFSSFARGGGASISFDGNTGPDCYCVKVDAWNYGNRSSNKATLKTKTTYQNITHMSFDLKIDGTISDSNPSDYWFGVGHSALENASIYTGIQIRNMTNTNNEWMHFDYSFNNVNDEYLYFVSNPAHGHNDIYIDNFVIVANGVTYTDGLTREGSSLFDLGQDTSLYEREDASIEDLDIYDAIINSPASFTGPEFVRDNLPGRESLLFGDITHEITGNGQYVILIYNDATNVQYLLIDNNSISLYNNYSRVANQNLLSSSYSIVVANNGAISINGYYLGTTDGVNNSIKFCSLFNTGSVKFTKLDLHTSVYITNSTETLDGIIVPNFEEDENITFAAYGSPTIANWTGGENNPSMATDEAFSDFVAAGFTKCIPLYEGRTGARYDFNVLYDQYLEATDPTTKESLRQQLLAKIDLICQKANQDAMEMLAMCDKYGVKYVVLNAIVFELIHHSTPNGNYIQPEDYEMIFDHVFRNDYEYLYQTNYVGNFLQDEPLTADDNAPLARLLAALTLYYRYSQQLGIKSEPIINLLPGGNEEYYINYLDYYFAHIAPMVGYVSFDQYVLDQNGSNYSIRTEHLVNLEMMAQRILASSYRIELRTYIFPRAKVEGSHRAITMADELRFQIYSNLVFGAREIIYYGYIVHNSDHETLGLVNMYTLEKSQVYYFAKEVNNEVLTFGQAYRHFRWEGVIAKKKSVLSSQTQFAQLQHALSSHAGLSSYSVNQHTLIGCFSDLDNQYAYVVMQYNDPKTSDSVDTVKLTFNNYNAIIVYQNGQKHAYRLTNHQYTLSLNPGCGAFVIPFYLD